MKQFIYDMFSQSVCVSLIRVNTFLIVLTVIAIVACILVMAFHTNPLILNNNGIQTVISADVSVIRELIYLAGTMLMIAFGAKVIQKFAERENTIEPKQEIQQEVKQ